MCIYMFKYTHIYTYISTEMCECVMHLYTYSYVRIYLPVNYNRD